MRWTLGATAQQEGAVVAARFFLFIYLFCPFLEKERGKIQNISDTWWLHVRMFCSCVAKVILFVKGVCVCVKIRYFHESVGFILYLMVQVLNNMVQLKNILRQR